MRLRGTVLKDLVNECRMGGHAVHAKPGSTFTLKGEHVPVPDRPERAVVLRALGVQVVGIFTSGFPLGDSQAILPTGRAQGLFGLEGKIPKIFVIVATPKIREKVGEDVRNALEESFDVREPRKGRMREM